MRSINLVQRRVRSFPGTLRWFLGLALFGCVLIAADGVTSANRGPAAVPPSYRLTDLGTINTNPQNSVVSSHAAGINQAGQVAGYSYSGTSNHAARFTNGLVEDLGTIPGGSTSYGLGINDLGQVVGDSQYDSANGCCRRAALFSNGTVTDLGTLPGWGNYSRAHGINQAGEVVGYSGPTNPTASPSPTTTRAFIWDAAGGMRDLGTLGGAGYSKALSINNSGQVTGEASTGSGFGDKHAFIWDAMGGMRDIGTIAGGFSVGNSINANGHVAGKSSINSFDNRDHAFLYDGTTMQDLGSLGTGHFFSDRSVAYGINIYDHVVGGTYRLYTGGSLYAVPFIYRDGQMYDLSTLVDASGADYQLGYATGINDAGQIAIDGSIQLSTGQIRAVLLTPNDGQTPTPTPTITPTPIPSPSPCGTPSSFANTTQILIPASGSQGIAAPYPSNILIGGLVGNVAKVTVRLNNINHTFPDDIDMLLVGPGGQNAIIMSDVGGPPDAVNVTLTLDDAALNNLPDAGPLVTGMFKPTNIGAGDPFPAPAPTPSGGSALTVFNGTNPNGTWSLYIVDDLSTDAGNLAGGWELNITTDCGSSTPTPTATPTATPTPMGMVGGTVSYANAAVPPVRVPNAALDAAGSVPLMTTTDVNGFYSLSGFGLGAYTITPSKTGRVNGISNADASVVAQHAATFVTLNANQLIAADVTNNGSVSNADASAIAQFAAAIPNANITGTWRFVPANRMYASVATDIPNQDYDAILMGEVTGNWNPAIPFAPDIFTPDVSTLEIFAPNIFIPAVFAQRYETKPEFKSDRTVPVMVSTNRPAERRTDLTIDLSLGERTGESIFGYQFELFYDKNVMLPGENPCDITETISMQQTVVCNATEPGVLRVVVFGALPIINSGTMLKLHFTAIGKPSAATNLKFRNFMFNEDLTAEVAGNGRVKLQYTV